MVNPVDIELMQRALFLAERGRGTTTPNPVVGAVVVDTHGSIVGQGAHREAGGPHAEVFALEAAGALAQGGTLYCTLEPCCHTGRTGPCTDRIIQAGIRRVIVAHEDPNPRVAGGGFAILKSHGISVESGIERHVAARQNAPFFIWTTAGRPRVTLKVARSRDGFAGRADGPVPLTGARMNRAMHVERAGIDAIAVGSSTVLIDDPRLTARHAYRRRPLVRVIFDRRGRVTAQARVCQTLEAGPVILFVADATGPETAALRRCGVDVRVMPPTLLEALRTLGTREVLDLLVEGGPTLHRAFWEAGLVDRVQVLDTSVTLGGGIAAFVPPRQVEQPRVCRVGDDVLTEWDVHRAD